MMWNIEDKISSELKLVKFIEENYKTQTPLLKESLETYKKIGIYPIDYILNNNVITEEEIVNLLAEKFNYPKTDFSLVEKDSDLNLLIKAEFSSYHTILLLKADDSDVLVSMFNPFDEKGLSELKEITQKNIIISVATRKSLLDKINEIYFSNSKALIRLNDSNQSVVSGDASDPIVSSEKRLIKFLESSNVLTPSVLSFLDQKSKEMNKSYLELFNENSLVEILSDLLGFPIVDLAQLKLDKNLVKVVSLDFVLKNICVPINLNKKVLNIAIFNPFQSETIINLEKLTGYSVKTLLSTKQQIYLAISNNYYEQSESIDMNQYGLDDIVMKEKDSSESEIKLAEEKPSENLLEISHEDAPVVKMVNLVISKAIKDKASDVHIEPNETSVIVRNRVDGVLTEVLKFQKYIQNAFISRIKILSKLDITEKRIPQDGKIKLKFENSDIDIRVSTLPTNFGETIVMRILDTSGIKKLTLDMLGFSKEHRDVIEVSINEPQGMILVTGPTGSGKSSTLYSFLKAINSPDINIITVEDPIEYTIEGISQVPVNVKAGLTFANALRAILRQDPDVVLIGEIRDDETAQIAFNASMTGHLVLSTLHTNDAVSAVTRLVDLNIPTYMIASSILIIIAQRLVRKNCQSCLEDYSPDPALLAKLGLTDFEIKYKKGRGCPLCRNSGYKGRLGVYEIVHVDLDVRRIIRTSFSEDAVYDKLNEKDFKYMKDDALDKVIQGLTTLEEAVRILGMFHAGKEK